MIIYKITNKKNGKFYIGQTRHSINDRWCGHIYDARRRPGQSRLGGAINKYGSNNFIVELIEKCSSLEELNKREEYWIDYLCSTKRDIGYNIELGEKNFSRPDRIKKPVICINIQTLECRRYESMKATSKDNFQPKRIGTACKGSLGFDPHISYKGCVWFHASDYDKLNKEQISLHIERVKRGAILTPKGRASMILKLTGRKHTDETKSKMREARASMSLEKRGRGGRALKGRKRSEETRRKISATKRRNKNL